MAYVLIIVAVLIYSLYPSAILQFVSLKIDILSYLLIFQIVAAIIRVSMAAFYIKHINEPNTAEKIRLADPLIVDKKPSVPGHLMPCWIP